MAFVEDDYSFIGFTAVRLLQSDGGATPAIQKIPLLFTSEVTPSPQTKDLTFEGNNLEDKRPNLTGYDVAIKMDYFNLQAASKAFKKNKIITDLPTGVAWRIYFGSASEINGAPCGLEMDVVMRNETTKANENMRLTYPVGTLNFITPPNTKTSDKGGHEFKFQATRTTVDIIGAPLPGVDPAGEFFMLDKLT